MLPHQHRNAIPPTRWPGKDIHDRPFWHSTAREILVHTATDLIDTVSGRSEGATPTPALTRGPLVVGHLQRSQVANRYSAALG
jgi:hypothetical protein